MDWNLTGSFSLDEFKPVDAVIYPVIRQVNIQLGSDCIKIWYTDFPGTVSGDICYTRIIDDNQQDVGPVTFAIPHSMA